MRGKYFKTRNRHPDTPLWISFAQLMFAALLLYVIRNPAPIQELEASLQAAKEDPAAMIVNIPVSSVAIAANGREVIGKQPM
jgi:hypothetical protein